MITKKIVDLTKINNQLIFHFEFLQVKILWRLWQKLIEMTSLSAPIMITHMLLHVCLVCLTIFSAFICLCMTCMMTKQVLLCSSFCAFKQVPPQRHGVQKVNLAAVGSTNAAWLPLLVGLFATCTAQSANRLSDHCVWQKLPMSNL